MIYRVSWAFEGAGVGWQETHAILNSSNNPKDLAPLCEDIANKRVQMLGNEFRIFGIRISRYSNDAGVRQRGVFPIKKTFRVNSTAQATQAEPSSVAYLVRGIAEPSLVNPQFDANTNTNFLGAPFDVCVNNAGVVDQSKGGLGAAFAAWRTVMLGPATIGWLANQTIAECGIVSIAQNANGTVTYTVDAADTATLTVGAVYKVRVRQVNQGTSPLNIEQKVQLKTATTFVTRRVIGIPTAQSGGTIRVYKIVQPFVDFGDLVLEENVGKHKRGRVPGSSPGRARKRILG